MRHVNDDDIQTSEMKIEKAGVKSGQRYRHAVTGSVYVVRDVGLFEGDLEPMVSYKRDEGDRIWFRYMSVFCGHVVHENTLIQRFVLIKE